MACLLSKLITKARMFNREIFVDNVILLLSDKLDEFIESLRDIKRYH